MRGATVCSGIGSPEVAAPWIDWRWGAEIDKHACAVLAARHPHIRNLGDMTRITADEAEAVDLIVAGTPCQDFSVAGLRAGLAGERGNLTLQFVRLLGELRPRWFCLENVPGLLSMDEGRAFGAILGALADIGYGFAYRVLDAQYAGVAQRRERVFVVGYLGDWRPPAAVLFERESLRRDPPPSREAGEGVARGITGRAGNGSRQAGANGNLVVAGTVRADDAWKGNLLAFGGNNTAGPIDVATARNAHSGPHGRLDFETETFIVALPITSNPYGDHESREGQLIAHSLRAEGFDASEDGTGRGTPLTLYQEGQYGVGEYDSTGSLRAGRIPEHQMVAFTAKDHGADASDIALTLRAMEFDKSHTNGGGQVAVAFQPRFYADRERMGGKPPETVSVLAAADRRGDSAPHVVVTGDRDADAEETRPVEALRALRGAIGEKAFCEWSLGVLATFWPTQILRSGVHGRRFRRATQPERGLVNVTLSCAKAGAAWTVLDVWQAGCDGCPPQGRGSSEQLARELGSYLSRLPYQATSNTGLLRHLWQASEGAGLLRQALSALQETWRSDADEGQPARAGSQVRRLTVEECEALQGFPRGFTQVPYGGKPMADGPRYRMLGNAMAVPVIGWILERLAMVDVHLQARNEAA